jgi:hypothetical protein
MAEKTITIESLEKRSFSELQRVWRSLNLRDPPRVRRRILAGLLAYKLQEKNQCAAPSDLARRLKQIAGADGREPNVAAAEQQIKPGTRLQRMWKNELHEVTALGANFSYRGRIYDNLSVIAREITGTRWSGPAFFGLRNKEAA